MATGRRQKVFGQVGRYALYLPLEQVTMLKVQAAREGQARGVLDFSWHDRVRELIAAATSGKEKA